MSANSQTGGQENSARSAAAEAVRQAFASLPFQDKLTTLAKVEWDMLGDIADGLVGAVEKAADEVARVFTCDPAAQPGADRPSTAS